MSSDGDPLLKRKREVTDEARQYQLTPVSNTDQLTRWLEDNAVWIHPSIRIRSTPSSSLGIVLDDDEYIDPFVQSGTILGIIPKSSCLSSKTSALAKYTAGFATFQDIFSPESTTGLGLATCLLYEKLLGEESKWKGYIDSLPSQRGGGAWGIPLPLFPTVRGQDAIVQGGEVARILNRAQRNVELPETTAHGIVLHHLTTYFRARALPLLHRSGILDGTHLSKDDLESLFLGAYSLVSSRGFICDLYHGLILAPLADIFNHIEDNQVEFQCDDLVCPTCGFKLDEEDPGPCPACEAGTVDDLASISPDTIEMRLHSPVHASYDPQGNRLPTEIYNSYGNLSNARLLTTYGFCLDVETNWERFTWDWDDNVERMETTQAFGLAEDDRKLELWSKLVVSLTRRQEDFEKLRRGREDRGKAQGQGITRTLPSCCPLYYLCSSGDEAAIGNSDLLVPPSAQVDTDRYLPLFVDEQGAISVSLYRASICAALVTGELHGNLSETTKIEGTLQATDIILAAVLKRLEEPGEPVFASEPGIGSTASIKLLSLLQKAINNLKKLISNRLAPMQDSCPTEGDEDHEFKAVNAEKQLKDGLKRQALQEMTALQCSLSQLKSIDDELNRSFLHF
jgi:hypothetical protein